MDYILQKGNKMRKLKFLLASLVVVGFNMSSSIAVAQQYNSSVSNPFLLCSAPKPCKQCQPMRAYWEQLCPGQQNQNTSQSGEQAVDNSQQSESIGNSPPQEIGSSSMTQQEIRAEIAKLQVLYDNQLALTLQARTVLETCINKNGPVQMGHCAAELADYKSKRPIELKKSIDMLQALLK